MMRQSTCENQREIIQVFELVLHSTRWHILRRSPESFGPIAIRFLHLFRDNYPLVISLATFEIKCQSNLPVASGPEQIR